MNIRSTKVHLTAHLLLLSFFCVSGNAWAIPVGKKAPNFSGSPLNGENKVKLSDYRGKVVLVDFWASWCPPCRKSLPKYDVLRNELSAANFEVIAINVDQLPDDGRRFLRQNPVSYPVITDPVGALPEKYQVKAMPTAYLLDKRGVVRYVHVAFQDGDIDKLRNRIMNLLEEDK